MSLIDRIKFDYPKGNLFIRFLKEILAGHETRLDTVESTANRVVFQLGANNNSIATVVNHSMRAPFAFRLRQGHAGLRASVVTAPTGADIILDVLVNGASILSSKLQIDATEKTSLTSAANVATGTFVVNNVQAGEFASGTIDAETPIAGDTVTVNGLVYTGVAGVKNDNTEYSVDTSNTAVAIDLADSINNDVRTPITVPTATITAVADTGQITITADVKGVAANAIDLATSGSTFALSGALLEGGIDPDTVTVNGLVYTAVTGVKADDTEFSVDTGNTECALDLADSIDDDVRVGITVPSLDVSATSSSATVTILCTTAGIAGNAIDLDETGTTITKSGAFLTLGIDTEPVIDTLDIEEDDEIVVSILQVGSGTAGAGLSIRLIGDVV